MVIAVIAILAALLLPALNRSMISAYTTACRGNLRPYAVALNNYTGDFHYFPPWSMNETNVNSPICWPERLQPYTKTTWVIWSEGMAQSVECRGVAPRSLDTRHSTLDTRPLCACLSRLAKRPGVCFHAGMQKAALCLALLGCLSSLAAEQRFYQQYLSFTASNPETWEVGTPLLVDTNNRGYKLTSVLTNLAKLKTTAALAGVRPGMTMDEVVRLWGKPPEMWAKGFEGPRFCYKEVSVFFDSSGKAVKSIFTQDLPALERSLSVTPKTEECLRALGPPSFRDDTATGSQSWLIYEMTNVVLKVGCVRGRLSTIQMDRRE